MKHVANVATAMQFHYFTQGDHQHCRDIDVFKVQGGFLIDGPHPVGIGGAFLVVQCFELETDRIGWCHATEKAEVETKPGVVVMSFLDPKVAPVRTTFHSEGGNAVLLCMKGTCDEQEQ